MSVQAMTWVMTRSKARLGDRLVMFSIANHADSRGRAAWPSIATIAEEARMSERQVQRALPRLVKLCELRIEGEPGPHGTHRFAIVGMGDNLSGDNLSVGDKSSSKWVTNRAKKRAVNVTQTVLDKPPLEPSNAREARSVGRKDFLEWYSEWPHKVGRRAAEIAFVKARRSVGLADLKAAVQRYIANKPPDRPWCNPATWLNQERWLDEPAMTGETMVDRPTEPPPAPFRLVG